MAKETLKYRGVRIVVTHGYYLVDLGVTQGWEYFQSLEEAKAFLDQRVFDGKTDPRPEPSA
jgi:hypothetical protein